MQALSACCRRNWRHRLCFVTESRAHPGYKQKLIDATAEDTVHTTLFGYGWPNAPVRTLRTAFVNEWIGDVARGQESSPDEPVVGYTIIAGREMLVLRFMGMPPNASSTGDIEQRALLAGQGVGLIREIKPAAEIVRELAEGTLRIYQAERLSLPNNTTTTTVTTSGTVNTI